MIEGKVCAKHPGLGGRRHNDRNCPGCVKERQATAAGKAIKAASYKRWRGKNLDKVRAYDVEYRRENPERIRDNNLRRTGFTLALFNTALALQAHACAICATDLRLLRTKMVHADHCHATGAPRGVLCHQCNAGLGSFRDDPERLRRAVDYLTNPPLGLA